MMEISQDLLKQIVSDLGLDVPFSKGRKIIVRNCWHFSTDGDGNFGSPGSKIGTPHFGLE